MKRGCHRALVGGLLLTLVLLIAGLPAGLRPATSAPMNAPTGQVEPVTSHPRLFLTAADLPRLRGWATDANPAWRDGLATLAETRKAAMDDGRVPAEDFGGREWDLYPTESYAELFAFLSLIHPDAATRDDYAARARTLLMYVMNEAVKGPSEDGSPFRHPLFATLDSNRSRWWGEGFALTVDWIYPSLTTEDKVTIRQVFLRWCEEIVTNGYHHPEPVGLLNDPALVADPFALRWSGNNYTTAQGRNLGLMAMALDPEDDPDGQLRAYLESAIGAHLYMADHLFRTDAAGGLAPEGFEYSPQSVAYVAQLLLALQTAGLNDPARWGPHVRFEGNAFWADLVPAYLHSLSPRPAPVIGEEYLGLVYQPAWYGEGEKYWAPDLINVLGAIGRYDDLTGNASRLDAIRWIQTNRSTGSGEELIRDRIGTSDDHLGAIFYFLLLDPAAPAPVDPRPAIPPFHYAPGIGRLLVRTGWDDDAAWFTYGLGWLAIDHQLGDGNRIEFYRDGEWLTKGLVGWGGEYGDEDPSDDFYFPASEYHNTLALENDQPFYDDEASYTNQIWKRGSQWEYVPEGDPTILALSIAPGYAYALGDATNLYNSSYNLPMDIRHASRSVVWLAPDTIVVYDRAESGEDGRFKRFWLNFPANATVTDNRTTMTTATGQQLVVTTLLPTDATPVVQPMDVRVEDMAIGEPMRYRLLVEAPGDPRDVRFFHVLQGADAGATVAPVAAFASADGRFAGTVVGSTAVLFPVTLGAEVGEIQYTAPADTTAHVVTGLTPDGGYDVVTTADADGIVVTVTVGTGYRADAGGVLVVGDLPEVMAGASLALTNTPAPAATPAAAPEPDPGTGVGTPATGIEPASPVAFPVTEGGAAATGPGSIVYTVIDESGAGATVYRIAAEAGAAPEQLGRSLDASTLPASAPLDQWIASSSDSGTLLLNSERFDAECAGWACLALVSADLATVDTVRADGAVVHPDGPAAIANGGDLIVFPAGGGPHVSDLWAITRQADGWSAPRLLTADSPFAFHAEPSLTTDGGQAVFECADQPYGAAGTTLCAVATDGSDFQVVLTPDDAPSGLPTTGALRQPVSGADGSVLFAADWDGTIWRLEPDSTVPEPVGPAFTNDRAPCLLSDGRIASLWLDRPGGQGRSELKVMTPDGTAYAVLVTDIEIAAIDCGG